MKNNKLYRLNHSVIDKELDVEKLSEYGLYMMVARKNLRVTVIDLSTHKCLLLEDYKFSNVTTFDDLIRDLETLFDAHQLLAAGYWKDIYLTVRNTPFSFVPTPIFDENDIEQFKSLTLGEMSEKWQTHHYTHEISSATNIFVSDAKIVNWFESIYPERKLKICHQASAFLKGILDQKKESDYALYISTEILYMNILVTHNDELLYSNSFEYKTPQDFIYYLMFVMDELRLDSKLCPVTIFGEISPDSTIYQLVLKYIKNVNLGNRPSNLSFGFAFDEILNHRYFDLFSSYLLA